MGESPPALEAPAAGVDMKAVPEQDGQPPPHVVDSTNHLTTSPVATIVDEESAKAPPDGDKSGFLSTSLASISRLARRSSTSAPPETSIPVVPEGRHTTDENGRLGPVEVPAKVILNTMHTTPSSTHSCSSHPSMFKYSEQMKPQPPQSTSSQFTIWESQPRTPGLMRSLLHCHGAARRCQREAGAPQLAKSHKPP
jgi:hypothetical protein